MPFIKKDVLKKKVEAATAPEHPLLKDVSLDVATKTAYVQGCALATLLDDEKTSDSEHDMVRSIGLSLGLTDIEIEECFSSVGELSNDDEKGHFVEEITSLLKKDVVNRFFMQDFERTVTINGKASDEVCEIVDYIGALIYNATDWRKKKALEDEKNWSDTINSIKDEIEQTSSIRPSSVTFIYYTSDKKELFKVRE